MFTTDRTLYEDDRVTVYRAVRGADQRTVVLKVLDPRRCRPRELERLKNEYEIGRQLDTDAVLKPIELIRHRGMPALVLEHFEGEPLDRLFEHAPTDLALFLRLASRIAQAVAELHGQDVVHKDLKPHNILVNPTTLEVKIVDLGIAARLDRAQGATRPLGLIEGSLPYMSPEQTGRMNRAVDVRSDLYSLGVTFYRVLTGSLPFHAADPLEWAHAHVARTPAPLVDAAPSVPPALSAIVMKLLAKEPDERYQSAAGLKHDLERCLELLTSTGRIDAFPLGERDGSTRFQIPQKLYGRRRELAALLDAFEQVVATGAPRLVLISGDSGIGKSSLVHELVRPIARERGLFGSGKFDQCRRDIPYTTLAGAFKELLLERLAESEERLESFRQRLEAALGTHGQVIVELIPEVELVVGKQPPVPELPLADAQNRLNLVFRQFVGVFARKEHPLTLFLDDLQWVDSASLNLLANLITDPDTHYLLAVGAYRDNEVDASHPLARALEEMRSAGAAITELVLAPLSCAHVCELVADTVHRPPEDAAPLARLVHEKTAGNPFFANQFLAALHQDGLLELDANAAAYRWDMARIEAKGFTDNVIALMVCKVKRLSAVAQHALQLAACAGNSAPVDTLAVIYGRSEEETHAALGEAVREGLLLRGGTTYRFIHDRVQEAAYSLIPERQRPAVHLRIGRLLLSRVSPDALEERIFEIVNQYNLGSSLLEAREERERLAELDLQAGEKAKAAAAYDSAVKYLSAGAALLGKDCWGRQYETTFALHLHRAECEYLNGSFEEAERQLELVLAHAATRVDAAAAASVQVALYSTQDRIDKAVDAAIQCLRRFGIEVSPRPASDEVGRAYEAIWQDLGARRIEDLIEMQAMTDPDKKAAMGVLAATVPTALLTDNNLLCLMLFHMCRLSLRYGNADASALGYAFLGAQLGAVFGNYKDGFRFGKLGYDLVEKRGLVGCKAKVYLTFSQLVNVWSRHVRSSVDILRRTFDAAMEVGDLNHACYFQNQMITLMLFKGDPLSEVHRFSERGLAFARKAKFGLIEDVIIGQQRFIQCVLGCTDRFSSYSAPGFDEAAYERHLRDRESSITIAVCCYYVRKLAARFLAGDYDAALRAAAEAERLLWTVVALPEAAEFAYFEALTLAALSDQALPERRIGHGKKLAADHERLERWAEHCADNFLNRFALVSAEVARLRSDDHEAMRHYEVAIRSARENGFVHNEGIASELAARFYRKRGFETIADTYLREARACFARWGAEAKVRQIDRLHPSLRDRRPIAATVTFAARAEQLDLMAVVKASQSISSAIVEERLIPTLLQVVLEQGGGQRACLLLVRDGGLWVEAEATLDRLEADARVRSPMPVERTRTLPMSIIHYVRRTKKPVLLDDAGSEERWYLHDDYIAGARPRSVLCLPIFRQAELTGMLYLENNLVSGAFTAERLMALELLAAQATISLENARLLLVERAAREVAEKAERRSTFLAEAGEILGQSLDAEEILRRLARLSTRHLADFCVVDLVDRGRLRRLVAVHSDPAKAPLIQELQRRYPVEPGSAHPGRRVIDRGEPLLLSELPDEVFARFCMDERHFAVLRALEARSVISVPLVVRGQVVSAITLVSARPGFAYGPADLELAQELARRAAVAVDNARLYSQTQEAVRMRDEFLSVAAHELRTPMTSLGLVLQSMLRAAPSRRPADPEALTRLVQRAARQGERMNRLIDDLLDVSRIETGDLPMTCCEVELTALVTELLGRFELDLQRSRCVVTTRADGPLVGCWDRSRIEQVISNLIANAIKFGAGKPIDITVRGEAGLARFRITDHGIGIDPDQQKRIFERFGRAVSANNYGGLGLGLYICRRIVEAHHGSIGVESAAGAGATFEVVLPCCAPPGREGLGRARSAA